MQQCVYLCLKSRSPDSIMTDPKKAKGSLENLPEESFISVLCFSLIKIQILKLREKKEIRGEIMTITDY